MTRVRSFLKLERGEELPVLLLFLYLTTALAAFLIAKAVRDSLFLEQFSAKSLPYAYIAVALVIGLVVSIYVRLASRIRQTTLICWTLVFFILNVLLLWWGVRSQWAPIAGVLYVWTNIFGIIITVQVWTVASSTLDTRQARRLFPLIGSGGILGATLGGMIAAGIVDSVGTDNLVLLLTLLLGVSIAIVRTLSRRYGKADLERRSAAGLVAREMSIGTVFKVTLHSRYLRLIALLLVLSAIVTLIIDFQFKAIAQESFTTKDELTGFFGSFYSYVGVSAFLLQFLAGPRIFEKYGLRLTLLVLPLALLAGTTILLAYPLQLWTGVLLKGSEGTLRYSIDRSTIETLTVEELLRLSAIAKEVHFTPGEVILREGEYADAIYLIVDGQIEPSSVKEGKRECRGAGTPVGGFSVLTREPSHLTARALSDTFALQIGAEDLYDLLSHNMEIVYSIFKLLIQRMLSYTPALAALSPTNEMQGSTARFPLG